MLEWIKQYWIGWAFGLVVAVGSAGFAYLKGKVKQQAALQKGVKALLYDRLWQAHSFYTRQGFISVPDLRNIGYLYEAYHDTGGNGTGTKLYEDLKRLPNARPEGESGEGDTIYNRKGVV